MWGTPTVQHGLKTLMTKTDIATFANGCFWGTEHMYRKYFTDKGLLDVKVGFIGGRKDFPNPTYRDVCTGKTGYAEAAQLVFDPVSDVH